MRKSMAKSTKLNQDVTLRMAKQIEATDGGKNDTIRSLGIVLELDKVIIDKATTLGGKSSSLVDSTHHLLNEWVTEHGSDNKAAERLRMILTKNGYSNMADVLKEDSTKKPVASTHGHSHELQQPPSTTDRIITLVTTIVVAILAISYINYRDFS